MFILSFRFELYLNVQDFYLSGRCETCVPFNVYKQCFPTGGLQVVPKGSAELSRLYTFYVVFLEVLSFFDHIFNFHTDMKTWQNRTFYVFYS